MSNRDLALNLARRGIPVFPCHAKGKRPLTAHGFKNATADLTQVSRWWATHPAAMPAMPTASFWILDLDRPITAPNIEAAAEALGAVGLDWAVPHARLVVMTPSGGLHLYFARVPGVAIGNRASDIAPGVDTRGHTADGRPLGQIIAPRAVRSDGRRYQILRGDLDTLTNLAPAPRRLMALAMFNRRERAEITADSSLKAALNAADPTEWRSLFDKHQAAVITARPRVVLTDDLAGPMRRQAIADLQDAADDLAACPDGRKAAAFKAACRVAKYITAGVLTEAETVAALLDAWAACGAAAKHGARYGQQQIAAGISKGRNDQLPPLARRFRDLDTQKIGHAAQHEGTRHAV